MIFQPINSDRSNIQSLKYYRCTPSGCKNIDITKLEIEAFLNVNILEVLIQFKDTKKHEIKKFLSLSNIGLNLLLIKIVNFMNSNLNLKKH